MDDGRTLGRVSFLGRVFGPAFARREIQIAPGGERPYDAAEWEDTIVVVERGKIALESLGGARVNFTSGDVLFLHRLPLRAIRNRGRVPVLLSAAWRRHR